LNRHARCLSFRWKDTHVDKDVTLTLITGDIFGTAVVTLSVLRTLDPPILPLVKTNLKKPPNEI